MIFYAKKTLRSDLTPDAAIGLLRNNVRDFSWQKAAFWEPQTALFHGKVNGNRFRLTRGVCGSQSFAPVIEGEIRVAADGSQIELRLRPQWAVLAVALSFGAIFGWLALAETVNAWREWLVPMACLVALGAAAVKSFARESRRAEEVLNELFVRVE